MEGAVKEQEIFQGVAMFTNYVNGQFAVNNNGCSPRWARRVVKEFKAAIPIGTEVLFNVIGPSFIAELDLR